MTQTMQMMGGMLPPQAALALPLYNAACNANLDISFDDDSVNEFMGIPQAEALNVNAWGLFSSMTGHENDRDCARKILFESYDDIPEEMTKEEMFVKKLNEQFNEDGEVDLGSEEDMLKLWAAAALLYLKDEVRVEASVGCIGVRGFIRGDGLSNLVRAPAVFAFREE